MAFLIFCISLLILVGSVSASKANDTKASDTKASDTNVKKVGANTNKKTTTTTQTTKKSSTTSSTLYVNSLSGNDSNDGSKDKPFQSMEKAISTTKNQSSYNNIYLYNGSYSLNKSSSISNTLTITGENKKEVTVNSDNNQLFQVNSTTLTLKNLKITGCSANYGGAIKTFENSQLIVDNCTFTSNHANYGGAISNIAPNVKITVKNTEFNMNNASQYGGAIVNTGDSSTTSIKNSVFNNNQLTTKTHNRLPSSGGALYFGGNTSNIVENSSFSSNYAYYGGAIYNSGSSNLTLVSTKFNSNKAIFNTYTGLGGAIMIGTGRASFNNLTFTSNSANDGGAIYLKNRNNFTIKKSYFANNSAVSYGGAISASGSISEVTIINSTFISNSARNGASYIATNYSITTNIRNSKFSNNIAEKNGGAIFNNYENNKFIIRLSTFNENYAKAHGGAFANTHQDSIINIINSNFTSNKASYKGGAILNTGNRSKIHITGSIFDSNYICELKNGNEYGAGGAIYLGGQSINLIQSDTFTKNKGYNGGAIYCASASRTTLKTLEFTSNEAKNRDEYGFGGGVMVGAGNINFTKLTFRSNTADRGGAISINSALTYKITNSKFVNNVAKSYGGAINYYGTLTVKNSEFTGNHASSRGGALFNLGTHDIINIQNSKFTKNVAFHGGVIATSANYSEHEISNSVFTSNKANNGGVINTMAPYVEWNLKNSKFITNNANNGGVIFTFESSNNFIIKNNLFNKNKASESGGVIYSESTKNIFKTDSSNFTGNNAKNHGGAIFLKNSNIIIGLNNRYLSNKVTHSKGVGGAIYTHDSNSKIFASQEEYRSNVAYKGSAIYNKALNSRVSSSVFVNKKVQIYSTSSMNAKFNWWGKNKGFKSTSKVNTDCPIVLTSNFKQENKKKKAYKLIIEASINKYNKSGKLHSLSKNVYPVKLSINNNTYITDSQKTFKTKIKNLTKFTVKIDKQSLKYKVSLKKGNNTTSPKSAKGTLYINSKTGNDKNTGTSSNAIKTLNKALTLLNNNSYSRIYLFDGKYVLKKSATINKDVTIEGMNVNNVIVTTKTNNNLIINKTKVTFKNLTFKNMKATKGGAIRSNRLSTLTIKNCIFKKNSASNGGAIYINNNAKAIISNSTFNSNTAQSNGGAIYAKGNNNILIIKNSKFTKNSAKNGACIATKSQTSEIDLSNNVFKNNMATNGAVIYSGAEHITYIIEENNFSSNTASTNGGVIYSTGKYNYYKINDNLLNKNKASKGGVIYSNGSGTKLRFDNTTVSGNTASKNGAVAIIEKNNIILTSNNRYTSNKVTSKTGVGGVFYIKDSSSRLASQQDEYRSNIASKGSAIYNNGLYSKINSSVIVNKGIQVYSSVNMFAKTNWWGSNSGFSSRSKAQTGCPVIFACSFSPENKTHTGYNLAIHLSVYRFNNSGVLTIIDKYIYPVTIYINDESYTTNYELMIPIKTNTSKYTVKLDNQVYKYKVRS
ncbi:MAG: hypothetical protein IJJ47_05460 [Methanosphaera sp.]|nr:hypothetical protein [Methanosphaera sp.]